MSLPGQLDLGLLGPPTGCVCEAQTWYRAVVIPVCPAYKAEPKHAEGYCNNCHHDEACHAAVK